MELTLLEEALLDSNRFFKKIFTATFFSVKILSKDNLDQVSATSIIFLALRKNTDSQLLKYYVDELKDRMTSDNSLALFDQAHEYCLSEFMQKALTKDEFYDLCKNKLVKVDVPNLAERIYGGEIKSFQRKRALKSLLLELSELREVSLYNLTWRVNTISRYTNRNFYDSIEIWLEQK